MQFKQGAQKFSNRLTPDDIFKCFKTDLKERVRQGDTNR